MLPWLFGGEGKRKAQSPKPVPSAKSPPLTRRWHAENNPLPTRQFHPNYNGLIQTLGQEPQPWLFTGNDSEPFDFCDHMRRLTGDVIARCQDFQCLNLSQILIGVTSARNDSQHGLQARVTPMRFRDGEPTRIQRGATYQVQQYFYDDEEILYLLTFCLPRYLDRDFDDKLITLFHELYHMNPLCNGDLRRHDGRYQYHSHSRKSYDEQMAASAREYLAGNPDPDLHAFLRLNFHQLCQRHGSVSGIAVPRPKVVRVS